MTRECVIFFVCLAFGAAYKIVMLAVTAVEKRAALKPVTLILDFTVTAAFLSGLTVFLIFYNDGKIAPYMILCAIGGYSFVRMIIKTIMGKLPKKRKDKKT